MGNRKGGLIEFTVDGQRLQAKGEFTYGLGEEAREGIVGSDGNVHGFKGSFPVPFIEGEVTDNEDLDLKALAAIVDSTITLTLANGKVIALRNAWSCNPDGMGGKTEEGVIPVRFEGKKAEEVI